LQDVGECTALYLTCEGRTDCAKLLLANPKVDVTLLDAVS